MSVFERRIQMLEVLSKSKPFIRAAFEDAFKISQSQANVILREFIKLGFLEKEGNSYRATEKTKAMFK